MQRLVAHPTYTIHVLTDQPLRQVLQKLETSGRLIKWEVELGEFDIHYKERTNVKGNNFIYELTPLDKSLITSDATVTLVPQSQLRF